MIEIKKLKKRKVKRVKQIKKNNLLLGIITLYLIDFKYISPALLSTIYKYLILLIQLNIFLVRPL